MIETPGIGVRVISGIEFDKAGFDGLQCVHCGEMIPSETASTERKDVRCPACGNMMPAVRQTMRVPSDRDLLAHPPSVVQDRGTVDGVRQIFIRPRPIGRACVLSSLGWFLGVLAVEAALVFGFGLRSFRVGTGSSFSVRMAAAVAFGLAAVYVCIFLMLLVMKTRGWRVTLAADMARIRVYFFGVLPWFRATRLDRSTLLRVDCVWYGGLQGQTRYRDFSPKSRPGNASLYADDGKAARPILTSDDFEIVLYVRALLNSWRDVTLRWPVPDGLSEGDDELVYRPQFSPGVHGAMAALIALWSFALIERLSGVRMGVVTPFVPLLVLFVTSVLRKLIVYRFVIHGDALVCTYRFLGLVRVRRYDRIGVVVSQGQWLGATGVFLHTGDGKRHRLAGDVDERTGARIVGWLKDKLCGDGRA